LKSFRVADTFTGNLAALNPELNVSRRVRLAAIVNG
jgi:hypothetical protein